MLSDSSICSTCIYGCKLIQSQHVSLGAPNVTMLCIAHNATIHITTAHSTHHVTLQVPAPGGGTPARPTRMSQAVARAVAQPAQLVWSPQAWAWLHPSKYLPVVDMMVQLAGPRALALLPQQPAAWSQYLPLVWCKLLLVDMTARPAGPRAVAGAVALPPRIPTLQPPSSATAMQPAGGTMALLLAAAVAVAGAVALLPPQPARGRLHLSVHLSSVALRLEGAGTMVPPAVAVAAGVAAATAALLQLACLGLPQVRCPQLVLPQLVLLSLRQG